jgi:hypothetical protein
MGQSASSQDDVVFHTFQCAGNRNVPKGKSAVVWSHVMMREHGDRLWPVSRVP